MEPVKHHSGVGPMPVTLNQRLKRRGVIHTSEKEGKESGLKCAPLCGVTVISWRSPTSATKAELIGRCSEETTAANCKHGGRQTAGWSPTDLLSKEQR